jgi:hypothetical protein
LSGSIPDLEFHFAIVDVEDEGIELNTDCRGTVFGKSTINEALEKARLANAARPNDDELVTDD